MIINKLKYFRLLFISLVLFFLSTAASSQMVMDISAKLVVKGGSAKDGIIKLYENGNLIENYVSDRSGKFSVSLDLNKDYIIEFAKEGYVTKKINIDTRIPDDFGQGKINLFSFAVELFQQYDEVNTVVFKQPVAKIKFYKQYNDFSYDTDYSKEILTKIQDTEKELEKAHEKKLQDEKVQNLAQQQQALAAKKAQDDAEKARIMAQEKAAAEARKKAEDEAKRKAEEEKAKQLEQQRLEAEKRKTEEEARKQAELLEKQKEAERQRIEAEAKIKAKAEEDARKKAALEAQLKIEEEARKKAAEEAAKIEADRKAQFLAQQQAEAEKKRKDDEAKKQAELIIIGV